VNSTNPEGRPELAYLLPYFIVLISFAVLMTLVYRRELLASARNWTGNGKSENVRKAA